MDAEDAPLVSRGVLERLHIVAAQDPLHNPAHRRWHDALVQRPGMPLRLPLVQQQLCCRLTSRAHIGFRALDAGHTRNEACDIDAIAAERGGDLCTNSCFAGPRGGSAFRRTK